MRNIKFIETEINSLIEIIELGNSNYDASFVKNGIDLLPKIKSKTFEFTTKEIHVLKSYTSNWLYSNETKVDSLFEKYWNKNVNNYLRVEDSEKEEMLKIDIIQNIKSKLTGIEYETFGKVFEKINKLKKIETIYVSYENNYKPYKIAFVNLKQNEILRFELNNLNDFESLDFSKLNKMELNRIGNGYSRICSRNDAFQIFEKYAKNEENETFEFCRTILN